MAMERELLKNAASKPCTLAYPFEKREMPKGNRGRHDYDEAKCTGCGMCSRVCPSFAIELKGLGPKCEGLKINLGACLFCQQCEESCPTGAIWLTTAYELAVINKADQILEFKRTPRAPAVPAAVAAKPVAPTAPVAPAAPAAPAAKPAEVSAEKHAPAKKPAAHKEAKK
jgi:formate hydrogenlyase subunit 6/NADH:ubiquinone oxidoreductase subunit I